MPVVNGIGVGQFTAQKHEEFARLLAMHVKIVCGVSKTRRATYYYLDLNAGSGKYEHDGQWYLGTPLIALRLLRLQEQMDYRAGLIEIDATAHASLRSCLLERGWCHPQRVTDICGDNREWGAQWCESVLPSHPFNYGLIYHDPNKVVDLDLIAKIAALPRCERMDVLVYLSATSIKRARNAEHVHDRRSLVQRINQVPKAYWVVREPVGADQWTFLIGSNWDYPQWAKRGYFKLSTPKGRAILDKLEMTEAELKARGQLGLFDGEATLPDVSGISAPSAVSSGASNGLAASGGLVRALPYQSTDRSASPPVSALGDIRRA